MQVIGTAGHVDHGKTTLIKAITGIDPDRLKEEQARQMTIDLGFAWLTLPDGKEVGIVDVPGHRDFIENMLAGVYGIDAALLVIAADEGVMPQTREHLAILDLLQIKSTLVVVTKIDLIPDPSWLSLVEEDIRSAISGTIVQDAPIIRVSSYSKAGFPDLLQAIQQTLANHPERPDLGRPRLPVDRVFSIGGFGTVVTGTLSDGQLSIGEEVEILPSGTRGRIRGLQNHKRVEDVSTPGSRTAVNISGVDLQQIKRGDVVIHPLQYHPTRRLDVEFHLLMDVSSPLRHNLETKLFIGTSETMARVRLLGREVLNPGETGWLQLELHSPVVAMRGDRFIMRKPSPGETLGGGKIIDPDPGVRYKRFDQVVLEKFKSISKGSPEDVLLQLINNSGPMPGDEIVNKSDLEDHLVVTTVDRLLQSGSLVSLGEFYMTYSQWEEINASLVSILSIYHRKFPLKLGMPREELKSRLNISSKLFSLMLAQWKEENACTELSGMVSLPGHKIEYTSSQREKVDQLIARFKSNPAFPPSVRECKDIAGEDVYFSLVDSDMLQPVSDNVVFLREEFDRMVVKIMEFMTEKGSVTLAEARDNLGTSRKFVQALLENLDERGITIRQGDYRKIKAKKANKSH